MATSTTDNTFDAFAPTAATIRKNKREKVAQQWAIRRSIHVDSTRDSRQNSDQPRSVVRPSLCFTLRQSWDQAILELGKLLQPGSQQTNVQQQRRDESLDSLGGRSSPRESSSVFPSVVHILKAQALREHVESFHEDHAEKAELMQVLPPGYDWSQAIREMAKRRSRAFLLLDLALIVHTLVGWRQQILKQVPKVRFLYNAQYNADLQLLKLLIRSDVGLVCTSRWDIQKCQEAAAIADAATNTETEGGKSFCRLYDSTSSVGKPDGFLRQLVLESDADTIVVDSAREIHRVLQALHRMRQRPRHGIPTNHPREMKFILRFKTNAELANWRSLVEDTYKATQHVEGDQTQSALPPYKSCLAGISVDLANVEDEAFPQFRSQVEEILHFIRKLHRDESSLSLRIDLTGFSSIDESKSSEIFDWWNRLCQLDYIGSITVDISHLLVSPAGALCTRIVGVREVETTTEPYETQMHYYIDDGCYGSLYNHDSTPIPLRSVADESDERKVDEGSEVQIYTSTIWGPTCDGLDRVCKDIPLPRLKRDNWLVFPNLGCSTGEGLGTAFNGFSPPDTAYCVLGYFRGESPTALK